MESYPTFHNEVGVPIVRIGCREFKCIGDKPPQDHPHIYLNMGDASEIVCPYCSTLFRFDPSLGGATLGQTYTQLHCARFQSARDRTCRPYAKIVQLYRSRTNRSSTAAKVFYPCIFFSRI